jgi:hypothetical protein
MADQGKFLFVYQTGHGLEIIHPAYVLSSGADPSRLRELLFWAPQNADGRQHVFGSLVNFPLDAPHVQEFLRNHPPDARWILAAYEPKERAAP